MVLRENQMLDRHLTRPLRVAIVLALLVALICQWNPEKVSGQGLFSQFVDASFEGRESVFWKLEALLNSNDLPAIRHFAGELVAFPVDNLGQTERMRHKQYLLRLATDHPRTLWQHGHSFEQMLTLDPEKQLLALKLISLTGYESSGLTDQILEIYRASANSPSLRCQALATAWRITGNAEYKGKLLSVADSTHDKMRVVFCRIVRENQLVSFIDRIQALSQDKALRVRVAAVSLLLAWDQAPSKNTEALISELSKNVKVTRQRGIADSAKNEILSVLSDEHENLSENDLQMLLGLFENEIEMVSLQIYSRIFLASMDGHSNLVRKELALIAAQEGKIANKYALAIIQRRKKTIKGKQRGRSQ